MNKALAATAQYFESSSGQTPQYLAWYRLFRREFTKFLIAIGATQIQIGKPNHFDMSGFFTVGTQAWYFSISDLRGSKDKMLIRTVKSYKDYTGGLNQYVRLDNGERAFSEAFSRIVRVSELQKAKAAWLNPLRVRGIIKSARTVNSCSSTHGGNDWP